MNDPSFIKSALHAVYSTGIKHFFEGDDYLNYGYIKRTLYDNHNSLLNLIKNLGSWILNLDKETSIMIGNVNIGATLAFFKNKITERTSDLNILLQM